MGELFTVELKGAATSIAVMVNWLGVFLVSKEFPVLNELLGTAICFWIFAAIMVFATVFIVVVVPETKGKSIQEIQDELAGRK